MTDDIKGLKHVARSEGTSLQLNPGQLGPPGIQGEMHILAEVPGDDRSSSDRAHDTTMRKFKLSARLSKVPPVIGDINGAFTAVDGSSYFLMPDKLGALDIASSVGRFVVQKNGAGEMALIEAEVAAKQPSDAQYSFRKAITPFLDHLSYLADVPVYIATIRIEDPVNYRTTVSYTAPYFPVTIGEGMNSFSTELFPIYAMYREAKNATSDFYKFLCFHKLLEGLLGPMRASVMRRAEAKGIRLNKVKDTVPASDDYSEEIKAYSGKSIKGFFDNVLTPEFRNAVAHFGKADGVILDMSEPKHQAQYANLILVTELCVRRVTSTHEGYLRQLG